MVCCPWKALSEITFPPRPLVSCGRGGLAVPPRHRLVQELVNGVDDVRAHEGEATETPADIINRTLGLQ